MCFSNYVYILVSSVGPVRIFTEPIDEFSTRIVLRDLEISDSGTYMCSVGPIRSTFTFFVRRKSSIFILQICLCMGARNECILHCCNPKSIVEDLNKLPIFALKYSEENGVENHLDRFDFSDLFCLCQIYNFLVYQV